MNKDTARQGAGSTRMQAEFDLLADEYRVQHEANVAITGESPEYFSEYKIADLAGLLARMKLPTAKMLDFGSGIGNSLPYLRKYFSGSELSCADVSARSIEIAQTRFPGARKLRAHRSEHSATYCEPGCGLLRLCVSPYSARTTFALAYRITPNHQAWWGTGHL